MPSNLGSGIAAIFCERADSFLSMPASVSLGTDGGASMEPPCVLLGRVPGFSSTVSFCVRIISPRRRSARIRISATSISRSLFLVGRCSLPHPFPRLFRKPFEVRPVDGFRPGEFGRKGTDFDSIHAGQLWLQPTLLWPRPWPR